MYLKYVYDYLYSNLIEKKKIVMISMLIERFEIRLIDLREN